MYTITRAEAAEKLWMSTRSVDRYVKAWKLRSKKDGKIIYIHSHDIENMSSESSDSRPEVIIPQEKKSYTQAAQESVSQSYTQHTPSPAVADSQSRATLERIYLDLRSEIKQKDQSLQDLLLRLGQAQEIAKNSVSMIEFKKSQYLLEESKDHLGHELETLRNTKWELEQKLHYEKSSNKILIAFCIILIIWLGVLWFLKI